MRHLIGLILAIGVGAALFLGAGYGFAHLTAIAAHGLSVTSRPGLLALAALGGTGLLVGITLAVRAISPLAPGLPGIALLAWSGLLLARARQALAWIPLQSHSAGAGFRDLLVTGVLALLGAAMIVPLFLPSRWRGPRGQDADEDDETLPESTGLLS
jgi:hypothetical protein